jgi:hypothetical protein
MEEREDEAPVSVSAVLGVERNSMSIWAELLRYWCRRVSVEWEKLEGERYPEESRACPSHGGHFHSRPIRSIEHIQTSSRELCNRDITPWGSPTSNKELESSITTINAQSRVVVDIRDGVRDYIPQLGGFAIRSVCRGLGHCIRLGNPIRVESDILNVEEVGLEQLRVDVGSAIDSIAAFAVC